VIALVVIFAPQDSGPGYCLAQSSFLRFDAVTGFWSVGGGGGTFFVQAKKGIGAAKNLAQIARHATHAALAQVSGRRPAFS
jgi:hypothetical protein